MALGNQEVIDALLKVPIKTVKSLDFTAEGSEFYRRTPLS
jgi:hypothetical protein